jgi:hypothetical protein
MTDPKENDKPIVQTRTPKKKVTTGIFDNLRKLPEPHPVEEILGLIEPTTGSTPSSGSTGSTPATTSTATRPSTPSTPPIPSKQQNKAVAPDRDYTKVANSIVRLAVPSGIFGEQGGKSKELYDTLYALTRGAIVARRKIRIPKDQLMKKAGIGSEVTLRKNLGRLRATKLIKENIVPGTHGGNEYEVFLPEEVGLTGSTPSTPSTPSTGSNTSQIQEAVEPVEATGSSPSLSQINSTTSSESKTFFKDQRTIDDDAALAGLFSTLKEASKELTGKDLSSSEDERWRELGELLVTELKIAAARTPSISSVPSFLTEHLRRRLWKKEKREMSAEGNRDASLTQPSISTEQARNCPDCGGSGLYYPEGYERGVARCRHEKINLSPPQD